MSTEATAIAHGTLSEADQALKHRMLKQCEDERLVLLTVQPFTAKLLMNLNLQPVVDDRLRGDEQSHPSCQSPRPRLWIDQALHRHLLSAGRQAQASAREPV